MLRSSLGNARDQAFSVQLRDVQAVVGAEEHIEQAGDGMLVAGFIQAQAQVPAPEDPQIDLRGLGALDDGRLATADLQRQGVEELPVQPLDALALKAGGEDAGQPVDTLGDAPQTFRTVIDRVETGDIGQQHLGRADVRVGLLAADMLLAGLQGHAQRHIAPGIPGHADDPPRNRPLVLLATGKERRMGPAVAHGHAKALGRTEHHVGPQLARRRQQQQAQQVGRHAGQRLLRMQVIDQRPQVANLAVGVRVLQQGAEHLVLLEVVQGVDHQFEAKPFGAGLHHRESLRMAVLVDEEQIAFRLGHALGQGHGFGGGGRFVQQRGVGQLQAGEVDGQLLEIEQGFEPALGDFRLVGCVGGVPTGVFQHVAQDHRGGQGAVITHADQAGPDLVLLGITAQLGQGGLLVQRRRQVQRTVETDARRHRLFDQLDPAAQAQAVEHRLLLGGVGPEVTPQKGIGIA